MDEASIGRAQSSLQKSFHGAAFEGLRFVDIGCGSGIFSLSAFRLGADPVVSLDVDPNSIASATVLHERTRTSASGRAWLIKAGSILDEAVVRELGESPRVFSWGVLHHTGAMWKAIENTLRLVAPDGLYCLALYNRPGHPRLMLALKRFYNRMPALTRPTMRGAYGTLVLARMLAAGANPIRYVRGYGETARGMSFWRDVEDWLGGLPYEFAEPDEVRSFVTARGFEIEHVLVRKAGANNEYLIRRRV
jgi:2-polyprenyl-6-hydroxyphenyl methylase/3-demethylubiquinone-9 3-methyltransferase